MSAILQNDVIPLPASISLLLTNFLEFSGNFYLALELLCQDEKATSHSYEALTSPLILATMDPSRIKATSIYGRFSPSDQQFLRRLQRSYKKEVTTSYRKQKKNFNRGKIWLSFSDFQLIIRASEFLTISIQISKCRSLVNLFIYAWVMYLSSITNESFNIEGSANILNYYCLWEYSWSFVGEVTATNR